MVNRLMTDDEKFSTWRKSWALRDAGKIDEAREVEKTVPMLPFMAKFYKERGLLDFFINEGCNMAEVEAEFGKDWLTS